MFISVRLEIRADEGRIDDNDLKLAGIGKLESLHIKENGNYDSDDSDSLLSQPCSDNTSSNYSVNTDNDENTKDLICTKMLL